MSDRLSRRAVLRRACQLYVAGLVATAAASESNDKVCADPSKMDSDKASLRQALAYVEKSPHANQDCSVCGFFTAQGDCGTCLIFNGGPVNPKGHCDSWSAKD